MSIDDTFVSLDETVRVFRKTQRQITNQFDDFAESIESLRPRVVNYSSVTMPRSEIIPQMQRVIRESRLKDARIEELQKQIDDLNATFQMKEDASDLKREYNLLMSDLEDERTVTEEIEELAKPIVTEAENLREEVSGMSEWASESEVQLNRDYRNEMEIKKESFERFQTAKRQRLADCEESLMMMKERLAFLELENESLREVPEAAVKGSDVSAFEKEMREKLAAKVKGMVSGVYARIAGSISESSVFTGEVVKQAIRECVKRQFQRLVNDEEDNEEEELGEQLLNDGQGGGDDEGEEEAEDEDDPLGIDDGGAGVDPLHAVSREDDDDDDPLGAGKPETDGDPLGFDDASSKKNVTNDNWDPLADD